MTGQSGKTGPPEEMGPPLPVYKAGREEQIVIQGPQAEELTALFGGKINKLITMKGIHCLAGILLVLGFVQVSWQVPLLGIEDSSSFEVDNKLASEPWELSNMKRHSEGTFSNDYSKYLEDRKAQDFVRWLMSNKRSGADKRHADGTFTSDVSSYLKEQAIKDFVANLKSGQIQRESQMDRLAKTFSRRHVDGSFTSDVNKVLDSIAAKEYLLWVMTSKPSGESNKRQDD